MLYPKADWRDNETHLLFDIGYAYAMIAKTLLLLERLNLPDEEARDLVSQIRSFKARRLQFMDEVYLSAHTLALQKRLEKTFYREEGSE